MGEEEAVEAEEAGAAAEAVVVADVEARKTRNGCQSPSWAVL